MSPASERDRALLAAKAFETQGDHEAAAVEYMRAGAQTEAIRVLTAAHKFKQAAWLILTAHKIDPASAGRLEDSSLKKHALTAAILFGRAGETQRAVELFTALGELERAAELLRKSGDEAGASKLQSGLHVPGPRRGVSDALLKAPRVDPARELERTRQLPRAAAMHLDAGQPYDAANALFTAGRAAEAFDALAKAPRDDPRYRPACVKAIAVAASTNVLNFSLEHFLGPFVASEPGNAEEADAFYRLGNLYELKDLTENAAEIYRRLMLYDARFRDAAQRLKRLGGVGPILTAATAGDDLRGLQTPAPRLPLHEAITEPVPSEATPTKQKEKISDRWNEVFVDGAVVAERYRLEERMGAGGMAAVFRATDLELSMPVAVKAYFPVEGDEDALSRFRRELRFARSVVHENVVRVFDIGVFQSLRYLTMELLEGQELRQLLHRPMAAKLALDYLVQACRGLQAAHDQGIVHRDVKPANLFVTSKGVVKVMDFGIARALGTPSDLTGTGVVAGTPQFIAPEQIRDSSAVTPAADIYALGVVAYRMLTGVLPFSSTEMVPLLMAHLEKAPPPLREHNPFISKDLEAMVLKCLAKQPADRFASCAVLAVELERLKATAR